ncbi:hypothetical protein [Thomasclavelia sp.]|uniref:hypothetical protein n=1 Tax=Thomasclavelia sp. TaxID=3025757 RepID=UPI0025D31B7C|nr:hypothetical protein [Thomasclavelia sp.]
MAKRKISKQREKKLDRYYTIAKGFLLATPFIAYLYVSLLASSRQITLPEVLASEPSVAVMFLLAMINPYVAYLLNIAQKKLKEGEIKFACLNFVLLLIGEAITLNSLYFMMIAFVFYQTVKAYDLKVIKTIKTFSAKSLFTYGGGSFMVVALAVLCLTATLRLM